MDTNSIRRKVKIKISLNWILHKNSKMQALKNNSSIIMIWQKWQFNTPQKLQVW